MLVLTRKLNESILIGDNIKITVLSIDGERVRLGLDAPRNVRILRQETITKSAEENRLAVEESVSLSEIFRYLDKKS